MLEPDELQNKTWLLCAKGWLEREKHESFSAAFTSSQLNLLDEFLEKEASLSKYLASLDHWLIKFGIKNALKELPSVGMLLAQLCKVKMVMISDSVSNQLFNCIIHLSDLSNPSKSEDTATRRAKKWAIDYFLKMIDVEVDGVDLFLMEEFGVSTEEYLKEQIKQASLHLRNMLLQHPKNFLSKQNICLNSLFEFCKLVDNTLLVSLFEAIVNNISNNDDRDDEIENQDKELLEGQLKWICENKKIIKEFPIETLHRLFGYSLPTFENYVLSTVRNVVDCYPGIQRERIKSALTEKRLNELCRIDVRYYLAAVQLLKESFLVIGVHHGIVELSRTLMKLCQPFSSSGVNCFDLKFDAFNGMYVKSPQGLTINVCEDHLRKFDERLSHLYSSKTDGENNPCEEFEVWWCNVQYADWVDEAILLLLDGLRQNVSIYLQLVLRIFFPTEYNGMTSYLQALTTYVYALRNLLQKKHIQLPDVEFLLSSFKRKLPTCEEFASAHALLIILSVVFVAKSSGIIMAVGDKYLENLLSNSGSDNDDTVYWFLYTVQLLLRPSVLCRRPPTTNNISNTVFKDIVKNRVGSIMTSQQKQSENNKPCTIDLTSSPDDATDGDVMTSDDDVKEESGLYLTCCNIIERLEDT